MPHSQPAFRLNADQQQRFADMLPMIQRIAAYRFRHIRYDERKELIAEVVALAFGMYVRLVQSGKTERAFPAPLAGYGCRQVRAGRRFGSRLNIRDVTSPHCQQRKNVQVESLVQRDQRTGAWQEMLVEDRRSTPADIAAARIDVPAFFQTLSKRDRRVAEKLAAGESTSAVARLFKVSCPRISQLRRELCAAWYRFHGEDRQAAVLA